jgi:hypothetical protein
MAVRAGQNLVFRRQREPDRDVERLEHPLRAILFHDNVLVIQVHPLKCLQRHSPPNSASCAVTRRRCRLLVWGLVPSSTPLGWVYRTQELHELAADLGRGLVLYPVAYMIEFEIPHDTGKAGAELFE